MIPVYLRKDWHRDAGWRASLKGQTAGYVSRKPAAVRISRVTRCALAVSGHRVADTHRTPFNVLHLVGPVPVTDFLLSRVPITNVDRILPPKHSVLNIETQDSKLFCRCKATNKMQINEHPSSQPLLWSLLKCKRVSVCPLCWCRNMAAQMWRTVSGNYTLMKTFHENDFPFCPHLPPNPKHWTFNIRTSPKPIWDEIKQQILILKQLEQEDIQQICL